MQAGQWRLRLRQQLLQQMLEIGGETSDARRFEQILRIGEGRLDTLGQVGDIQPQIEVRGLLVQLTRTEAHARQGQILGQGELLGELHLKQRVVAQAALRRQRLDQLLERQQLVILRA